MTERSIAAYDVSQRVKTYDADMELMHPNRSKMVQIAIEVLPFPKTADLRAIDLGIGTGYFTERFLNHFPNSRVLGIDGAQAMIELAKARLISLASRVQFVIGDFRKLQELAPGAGRVDVVFSAYALHHLSRPDKGRVLRQVVELLVPGGSFVNADLIVADCWLTGSAAVVPSLGRMRSSPISRNKATLGACVLSRGKITVNCND